MAGALAATLLSTTGAEAQAASQRIVSPKQGALVQGATLTVRVRADGPGFRALVGARDVTRRFRTRRNGVRVAQLRRGRDLRVGANRLVISSGRGNGRRYVARTFTVGVRRRGALRMRRIASSRAALRVRLASARKVRFRSVRITLNGKRVRTSDWVPGERTRSTEWPLARTRFDAMFGARDGLRFGRNRLTIAAWGPRGSFDRITRTFRVTRRAPLVDAAGGRRTPVRRHVVLDGRATRARRGADVRYRWRIVRKPRGSKARLRGAGTARPRLVADRRGTYRVRLAASHVPKRGGAAAAQAGPAAVDEVTVQATPATGPIGVPVDTIAGGGISVNGTLYPATSGAWVQLLTLDRATLEVTGNQSFGQAAGLQTYDVDAIENAVGQLDARSLVIMSGGGRAVNIPSASPLSPFQTGLMNLFMMVGADAEPPQLSWGQTWTDVIVSGAWSAIGVPNVSGSGHANLYGLPYGSTAGAGGPAGNLSGYLQQDNNGNYTFATGNRTSIDTNVAGAPTGTNQIQVGAQTYTSQALAPGQSGFHVLILDALLNKVQEQTYVTNGGSDPNAVTEMQELISDNTAPSLGTPGHLVVVQSIGQPTGAGLSWINDGALTTHAFGTKRMTPVPRDDTVWYAPASSGESLAGALGQLGGATAHDYLAQMVSTSPQPSPGAPGGYALVASVGQLWGEEPIDPGSTPEVRGLAASSAGIVGGLERDRQGLWSVDAASNLDGFASAQVGEIAYQAPTPWPLSSTAAQQAANKWITRNVGFKAPTPPDMRTAYYEKSSANWSTILTNLKALEYQAGQGFDQPTFQAVQAQLAKEVTYVSQIWPLISDWQLVFTSSTVASYIDLQTVASNVIGAVQQLDSSASGSSQAESIIGDVLWFGSSIPLGDSLESSLGVLAAMFDIASDTSSDDTGGPSVAPVEAEVAQLGAELAANFDELTATLPMIGAIFVSDWGKLQEAGTNAQNSWAFDAQSPGKTIESIELSAESEFYTAMLPTVFGQYVADPPWIMGDANRSAPWNVDCTVDIGDESGHVFTDSPDGGTWTSLPAGFDGNGNTILSWSILSTPGQFDDDGQVDAEPDMLDTTVSNPMFAPIGSTKGALGMSQVEFYGDSRWNRWWFWCQAD